MSDIGKNQFMTRDVGTMKERFLETILKKEATEKKENHYNVITGNMYNKLMTEYRRQNLPKRKHHYKIED